MQADGNRANLPGLLLGPLLFRRDSVPGGWEVLHTWAAVDQKTFSMLITPFNVAGLVFIATLAENMLYLAHFLICVYFELN